MPDKQPAVYMMSNASRSVLYIGVTSDLIKRAYQHKNSEVDGFTKRYACTDLIYYELGETMEQMIHREKRLKKYRRNDKNKLISAFNPKWLDLYERIL